MVFSSAAFLYFFLPVFLILYYASPAAWRNWTILVASLDLLHRGCRHHRFSFCLFPSG